MNNVVLRQNDRLYPDLLKEIAHPPKKLYLQGHLNTSLPLVAVVGSRKATSYGIEATERICSGLVRSGIGVVSGLAHGIDTIAHKATLKAGGYTIAVLAHGLDRIYPAANQKLAKKILLDGGALLSEYPAGTAPLKQNFVARNRIVAGLCIATVVTEAAERSGSLITAGFALEQNRDVLAVPGNITNINSQGTNNLIRSGAGVITSAQDVLEAVGITSFATETSEPNNISEEETAILKIVRSGITKTNDIIQQTGWNAPKCSQILSMLEIKGLISRSDDSSWTIKKAK